ARPVPRAAGGGRERRAALRQGDTGGGDPGVRARQGGAADPGSRAGLLPAGRPAGAGARGALRPNEHAGAGEKGIGRLPDDVGPGSGYVHRARGPCRRGASAMSAPAAGKIAVVVCEDQPQILRNQVKILQESPEIEVTGTALSGETVLELLERGR